NALGPHLLTLDSGKSWTSVATHSEAWTPYGDPNTRNFFIASELDKLQGENQTGIYKTSIANPKEQEIEAYQDSGISGGIAGYRGCGFIMYAQGRLTAGNSPRGLI